MENYTSPQDKIRLNLEKEIMLIHKDLMKTIFNIREYHPELIQFVPEIPEIEEMEKDTELALNSLRTVQDSLNALLSSYSIARNSSQPGSKNQTSY